MLRTWRLAFFAVAAAIPDIPMNKVLFSDEIANEYGAKCLDGTNAGYFLREVTGSQDWVIYLEGGGLCVSAYDCISRSKGGLGSSKYWAATHHDNSNVMNSDPSQNPFAGMNTVFLPYCSGDTWLGSKKYKNWWLGFLYTNGHLILETVLDHLHNTTSMQKSVGRVLLAGDSAGGIGSIHNADWLTQTITQKFGFTDAIVKATPQAGLFFPSRPSEGICAFPTWPTVFGKACPRIDLTESWYVGHIHHGFVHEGCAKALKGSTAQCWDSGILARYVKTPLFIMQNRYDQFQMGGTFLCGNCTDNPANVTNITRDYMAYFGKHTEDTLKELEANFGHSVFMPNCFRHTENLCIRGGLRIEGESYNTSLSNWFFNDKHASLYDDCGEFPCSQTCECDFPMEESANLVV